ncbi:MAG: M23 family metallopeptidase [Oscillospiraceae bacterium]|nr:M23 family metallopeptidase [Oscillospiraceae bacterium]
MYKEHIINSKNEQLTSGFRPPNRPTHVGCDYIASDNSQNTARGVDIIALADGTVSKVAYDSARGNYVDIAHNSNITTRYQHLRDGVKVKVGDIVKKGQAIAVMGNTGDCSSSNPNVLPEYRGTHLHLEIHVNGVPTDPEPYLTGAKMISTMNTVPPSATVSSFKVGDKVKVKQGAKDYNGVGLASFVYTNTYDVQQVNDDRVVIGIGGKVTAAVNAKDLQKV